MTPRRVHGRVFSFKSRVTNKAHKSSGYGRAIADEFVLEEAFAADIMPVHAMEPGRRAKDMKLTWINLVHQSSAVFFSLSVKHPTRRRHMTGKLKILGIAAAAVFFCSSPLTLQWSPAHMPTVSLQQADARVGRPLTPGSVAGVNRRVHRRAYYGAAAGAAAAGAAAYGVYNRAACGYYPYPPCQ